MFIYSKKEHVGSGLCIADSWMLHLMQAAVTHSTSLS